MIKKRILQIGLRKFRPRKISGFSNSHREDLFPKYCVLELRAPELSIGQLRLRQIRVLKARKKKVGVFKLR